MGALEHPGGTIHHRFIQLLGVEIGAVHVERVLDAGVIDTVGVLLFDTGADGVEIVRHLKGGLDGDILRDMGIDGKGQAIQRNAGIGAEIGHVMLGVDTGVGAAAAGQLHRMAADHAETALQRLGHGDLRFLHLPAVVGAAVIHQCQGDIAHRFSLWGGVAEVMAHCLPLTRHPSAHTGACRAEVASVSETEGETKAQKV